MDRTGLICSAWSSSGSRTGKRPTGSWPPWLWKAKYFELVRCVRIRRSRFTKERGVQMTLKTSRAKLASQAGHALAFLAVALVLIAPAMAASCESLNSLALANTTITATSVAAGAFAADAGGG